MNGDTVIYAAVKHLAKFASYIWQIHPFGEGKTRATAVFMPLIYFPAESS